MRILLLHRDSVDGRFFDALGQGSRTYGMGAQNGTRKDFLGTRYSLFFFISFPRPVSLYCQKCVYIHISDCVEIVYVHVLPLLPNNMILQAEHFYANRERCEVLTGYLPLERRPGGDWANT